jgi:hypothetical protein
MMQCNEAQELITGLVDQQLSADERLSIENHLAQCADCRAQFESETTLKQNLKLAGAALSVPRELREKIEDLTRRPESERGLAKGTSTIREWLALPWLRPGFALVTIGLVAALMFFQFRPSNDIGSVALAVHEGITSGKTTVTRSSDTARLRADLALAVKNKFAPIALDLSALKLYPVAGLVKQIGGREVLVTVYSGDGPTITCFTFLGGEGDAPRGSELFFDAEKKINFYSFTRGGLHGVMHREGGVICLLVSDMPAADLLAVARGQRHHA